MIRLLVWRHGRTVWNAQARVQGMSDIDLDEAGEAQAHATAPLLASYTPDLLVSSDLKRAVQTAAALAQLSGLAVEIDPRLRERDYGVWQGLTVAEIEQRYPAEYARWRAGQPLTDPGFETADEVGKRATAALRDVAERAEGATAVAVTHGHAARAGIVGLLNWPASAVSTLGVLENCHFAELRHSEPRGWQLRAYNLPGALWWVDRSGDGDSGQIPYTPAH
ncbi:MAG: histidine phosphatase family protein [Micromonosporaceae bacterium]